MFVPPHVSGMNRYTQFALWILAIVLFALPAWAQRGGGSPRGGGSGGGRGTPGGGGGRATPPPIEPGMQPSPENPMVMLPTPEPVKKPVTLEEDACFPWDLSSGSGTTISAVRLSVPSKARSEYDKACSAFKKSKPTDTEQHARAAIEKYPNYPAAWVMLGQSLQAQGKLGDARDACSKPLTVDRTYLPPYLCLAGLLDHEKEWNGLLKMSDQFVGMGPSADMYACYYRGLALFHLEQLPEAQKSVQQAIELDPQHHQPSLNFLSGLIYGRQGDVANATLQVQQFIKYSANPASKEQAKEYLAGLQARQGSK
jgi:tetratricopeptide (TPR) repeat protein